MDIVPLAEQAGRALPEFRTGYVAQLLHHYADLLSAYPPRKDIVRSYAWALPCLYSKVATKKFQFSLVAQLLHAFGYRPALNRQHRKRDRERGGYDPPDQSLERNLRNFINQHPVACERLQTDLAHDDENEEMRRQEEFDRFAEKDLPMGLLAEFNPFDLRALFGIGARRTIEAQRGNTQTKKLEPPQKFDPGQERKPRRRLEI
ncbi:MAG TPA: hypothetical protein VMS18_13260 [Candidatus Binatia bacterium]|nr:hypothetical protein [Candidatus Binatia bacterium]